MTQRQNAGWIALVSDWVARKVTAVTQRTSTNLGLIVELDEVTISSHAVERSVERDIAFDQRDHDALHAIASIARDGRIVTSRRADGVERRCGHYAGWDLHVVVRRSRRGRSRNVRTVWAEPTSAAYL